MGERRGLKRLIGGIYSYAADTLYEPLVVNGAFKLFGGDLNELVTEQGRRAVASSQGGPILDLPVGTGYFTRAMARRHQGLVVGVDIAWGMVRRASADARSERVDNLVTVQADAHHLPFDNGAFRAVVCSNGLQVMPGLTESIAELVRVLAPGGRMYVSVIVAPLGAVLPEPARDHLPTMLRPARDVQHALSRAGLGASTLELRRMAGLIEGTKT